MKSHNVEDAVLEVIDLLCDPILDTNTDEDLQIKYSNEGLDFEQDESNG
jgi:hypothetical protein